VWGSEFTSKDATLQGDPAESAAGLNAKFWDSVTAWSRATPTILLNDSSQHVRLGFCTSRRAARWGNARHRPKHAATRLPPAGPPEAHAVFFAAGANGTNMRQWLSARRIATANDPSWPKVHRRKG
jgi:hypothetical protein